MASFSKKLLKELPPKEKMEDIFMEAFSGSDHGTVLSAVAYLDHSLELLFKASFRKLDKDEAIRMFDGAANAILGTTSNKIRMAYAMRLIDKRTYDDLMRMNDIRNVFAHTLHSVSFDTPAIKEDCDHFDLPSQTSGVYVPPKTPRDRFFHAVIRAYLTIRSDALRLANSTKEQEGA
jgi:hypothetical protein